MDASHATGRLWHISGESVDLMRISATLEHGTDEQVSSCIPVAIGWIAIKSTFTVSPTLYFFGFTFLI
jgi:hypothetical protein